MWVSHVLGTGAGAGVTAVVPHLQTPMSSVKQAAILPGRRPSLSVFHPPGKQTGGCVLLPRAEMLKDDSASRELLI